MALNIIARKPRDNEGNEYIVVDRGEGEWHRYVSATANAHSLASGEWFWGHYFVTLEDAISHFSNRAFEGCQPRNGCEEG